MTETTEINVLQAEIAQLQANSAKAQADADLVKTRNSRAITLKQARIAELQNPQPE